MPAIAASIAGIGLLGAAVWFGVAPSDAGRPQSTREANKLPNEERLDLPPNLLRQIVPEVALQRNSERPFSTRPDDPAARFNIRNAPDSDVARATLCLAQAIYYEAGGEGPDGERAVAQVVLNRVRHPGFPASVCGTVYQGSERATGCQFTFTCDGSLRRTPGGALWSRAQRLAREAFVSGHVFAPVGHATHYHADYVMPYWADSLDKEIQIGRHIFYRLKGRIGSATAFSQRYLAAEPAPSSPSAAGVALQAIDGAVEAGTTASPDGDEMLPEQSTALLLPKPPALVADETSGTLIGAPAPPIASVAVSKADDCPAIRVSKQAKPIAANNTRSDAKPPPC